MTQSYILKVTKVSPNTGNVYMSDGTVIDPSWFNFPPSIGENYEIIFNDMFEIESVARW